MTSANRGSALTHRLLAFSRRQPLDPRPVRANPRVASMEEYVCVSVTDNGSGMTAAIIEKAFEPFFTTKPIGQGTGLGLSMIYAFAHQSAGNAKIYSEVGKGTTVKLYLPRYRVRPTSRKHNPRPPTPMPRKAARPCWWSKTNPW